MSDLGVWPKAAFSCSMFQSTYSGNVSKMLFNTWYFANSWQSGVEFWNSPDNDKVLTVCDLICKLSPAAEQIWHKNKRKNVKVGKDDVEQDVFLFSVYLLDLNIVTLIKCIWTKSSQFHIQVILSNLWHCSCLKLCTCLSTLLDGSPAPF